MSQRMITLCVLLMLTGAQGFGILPGDSMSHLEITEAAILNVTVQVCCALAAAEGAYFSFPARPFTVEGVAVACGATESRKTFRRAIRHIIFHNVRVDLRHALNASFHFDEEMFDQGRNIISQGIEAIKASNEQENYETSRQKLGEIMHPLQDFYSHSNWVELKNKFPNSNLLRSGVSIGNLADESRATCRNCDGGNCTNNILEDIIQEKILTSGYFGVVPMSSTKPKGKCSHGGAVDQTSTHDHTGGINKDSFDASHGHLHTEAAKMATAATSELLEDIRSAAGDRPFLRMMGLFKGSNKALCFVIDTTKSMSDEIEAVRTVSTSIIDSEVGTENQPAIYSLVPFSDPEFGPLIRTLDPEILKMILNSISIGGGGDEQELSLSGLQLALGGSPFNSEVFLFTDGPAKDAHLKSSVTSLIERTQTVVNFIISTSTSPNSRRRRRRDDSQQQQSRITATDAQLYRELAQTSGGQMVEVSEADLTKAASIISDTLDSSLVMLLQAARSPGKDYAFSFIVDDSITNPRVYITGRSFIFILTSPTGESQQSTDWTGSLITSSRSVGNLQSLQLKKIIGSWEIKMMSANPYTIKAIGKSPIDFLFDFAEKSQGPFQGYDALDSRPRAGVNGSLLVSFTGSDTATVTEVSLVESWGSKEIKGAVQPQGSGNFLVLVDRIPSAEFAVRVKGEDSSSGASMVFQRQSRTNFRSSNLTINADSYGIIDPLTPFSVPFSVMANGAGGNFTIRATNNQLFPSTFPTSLLLETGKTTNGTVTLSAPRSTLSGTDVTLTIEAEAPDGKDLNYIVLRSTVINTITDFIQPECQLLTRQSNCSGSVDCSSLMWMIFVRVTDGAEGTGVDHVRLLKGNGTIIIEPADDNKNVTMVLYTSACCSPEMELVVVDKIGNVGICYYSSDSSSSAALSKSTKVAEASLLVLCIFVFGQQLLTELGLR